jgi:hypothetical protein
LNKLSHVKKYFLNRMALLDLDVVGRQMLGPGLKESESFAKEKVHLDMDYQSYVRVTFLAQPILD